MKKLIFLVMAGVLCCSFHVNAQKYITKEGHIHIFSQTPLFTIEGLDKKVASIVDFNNGDLVATTLVLSFKFHEALVGDHFNENYMQSDKYPKAYFKGKITNYQSVNLKKDGTYKINLKGDLTIHGTTNPIDVPGTITVKSGAVSGATTFDVSLKAYKIKIEESYKRAIKDDIKLDVNFDYSAMK